GPQQETATSLCSPSNQPTRTHIPRRQSAARRFRSVTLSLLNGFAVAPALLHPLRRSHAGLARIEPGTGFLDLLANDPVGILVFRLRRPRITRRRRQCRHCYG